MAYAERLFSLAKVDDKGVSAQAKLEQYERSSGKHPAALDVPDPPTAGIQVWMWWNEISQGRTENGMARCPMTWLDIQAWANVTGTIIRPWEVRLLRAIDNCFMSVHARPKEEPAI